MYYVAQCWDDGVLNDLKLTELLRKYHAKATFNLNPGLHKPTERLTSAGHQYQGQYTGKLAVSELKEVYAGFQITSHGMFHRAPCHATPEQFIRDAVDGRKFLEDLWQREWPGYVWPGGITDPVCAQLLRDAGFVYARTIASTNGSADCKDPIYLNPSCHYQSPDFISIWRKVRKEGGIFYFWGHSYEMLDSRELWDDFEQKLSMICSDAEAKWIDVIDIISPEISR